MTYLNSKETNYTCFLYPIFLLIYRYDQSTEGCQIDINWNDFTKIQSYIFGCHKYITNDITNEEPAVF